MTSLLRTALALAAAAIAWSSAARAEERILPVPAVTIYAGDTIDETMIKDRTYPDTYRFRTAVVESPRILIGKMARRTLVPGEAIPLNAIDDPKLVSRGVPATLVFEEGGLSITGVGTPLESGTLGESIRVKNMDSGRIIVGRVLADGRIRVGAQ